MFNNKKSTLDRTLVAIDIAKKYNTVLVQSPNGKKRAFKMANNKKDYLAFKGFLRNLHDIPVIAFEATGNYHRPLAYFLKRNGFAVRLISSVALARTRDALFNTWDKNDPKDAQVILHLMKTGVTQTYRDPILEETNDILELSRTHFQVSLLKTRVQHSILTHFLPLYFPEMDKYYTQSRAQWFTQLLYRFPCPSAITCYTSDQFQTVAWDIVGRKVNKKGFLKDLYMTAQESIGLDVTEESQAMGVFRLILKEHMELCEKRDWIQKQAAGFLEDNHDFQRLKTLPGVGPIIALTILAEAGDLRRFSHHRKFLKYCGFDLSTQQSGQFRGQSKISKRGNARLRYVFWLAATIAVRIRGNSFRRKFDRYMKNDPKNSDVKRKAYTAVAAKMARVAYGLIKNDTDYYPYHEESIPGGKIPSVRPVEATMTS